MRKILILTMLCFLILSCSDNKNIEKINDVCWVEKIDAYAVITDEGNSFTKSIHFNINGIKYTVFLWYNSSNEVEPFVIDVSGVYDDNELGFNGSNYFSMRLEPEERYFKNYIEHKNIGFESLYDKKNKALKYTSYPKQEYRQDDFYVIIDEDGNEIFIDKEWELEYDWKIIFGNGE